MTEVLRLWSAGERAALARTSLGPFHFVPMDDDTRRKCLRDLIELMRRKQQTDKS